MEDCVVTATVTTSTRVGGEKDDGPGLDPVPRTCTNTEAAHCGWGMLTMMVMVREGGGKGDLGREGSECNK